jgi:hypothetical protein
MSRSRKSMKSNISEVSQSTHIRGCQYICNIRVTGTYFFPSANLSQMLRETVSQTNKSAPTSAISSFTALFASPSFACADTHSSMTVSVTERMPSLLLLAPGLTWQVKCSDPRAFLTPFPPTKRTAVMKGLRHPLLL